MIHRIIFVSQHAVPRRSGAGHLTIKKLIITDEN